MRNHRKKIDEEANETVCWSAFSGGAHDRRYFSHAAKTYAVKGDQLTLSDSGGKAIANYTAQSQDLAGTSWLAIGYNNGKQAVVSLIIGSEITLDFGTNNQVAGSAGCNRYTGGYEASDKTLKVGPLVSTQKACTAPEV